jgi:predicted nucleic acid-binding protein
MKKIYLDSNVIVKFSLEPDADVKKILDASRNGQIVAYASWLSLTEVSGIVYRTEEGSELSSKISEIIRKNKIRILSDTDRSTSSASNWTPSTLGLDYSDSLHLLIARGAKVDYFVTYDHEMLLKGKIDSIAILRPHAFVERVLEG